MTVSKSRSSTVAGLTPAQKEEIRQATERSIEYLINLTRRIRELAQGSGPFAGLTIAQRSSKYFERLWFLGKGTLFPQFQNYYCRSAEIKRAARRISTETGADEGLVFEHLRSLMSSHIRRL